MLEHVADEAAIDLELVQRQRRQVAQRGVALAEVVEADRDSGGGQPSELDRRAGAAACLSG